MCPQIPRIKPRVYRLHLMNTSSGEDYFLLVRAESLKVAKLAFTAASGKIRALKHCNVIRSYLQRAGYAHLPHLEANYDTKFGSVFVRPILT